MLDPRPHSNALAKPHKPDETYSGRIADEELVQTLACEAERDVHPRPVFLARRAPVEPGSIDFLVQPRRLPFVHLRHRVEPTVSEEPLHHQTQRVHRKGRWRIVE